MLKDIRDRMVRPIGGNNGGNGNNDDNDEIAETGSIDLSWMNDLLLYRQIASDVFTR